jgi:addiction module HigA family antidote
MTMKNPPHPGLSVRHDCIEPLGLTITEAADILGVTRQTVNNLVNGKSGISADMAIRLDKPSAAAQKRDCGCKWPMTSHRPASTRVISRLSRCREVSCRSHGPKFPGRRRSAYQHPLRKSLIIWKSQ